MKLAYISLSVGLCHSKHDETVYAMSLKILQPHAGGQLP